jgi:hypothetical protein
MESRRFLRRRLRDLAIGVSRRIIRGSARRAAEVIHRVVKLRGDTSAPEIWEWLLPGDI